MNIPLYYWLCAYSILTLSFNKFAVYFVYVNFNLADQDYLGFFFTFCSLFHECKQR